MKEDRTEYVSMWVSPETAKEFNNAKDDATLKDKVIRDFITGEVDWVQQELSNLDEASVQYKAKLIYLKDSFKESQDIYVQQIEEIQTKANNSFKKFDLLTRNLEQRLERIYTQIKATSERISYINSAPLEKMIEALEKFDKLNSKQKELITLMLKE